MSWALVRPFSPQGWYMSLIRGGSCIAHQVSGGWLCKPATTDAERHLACAMPYAKSGPVSMTGLPVPGVLPDGHNGEATGQVHTSAAIMLA